MCKMKPKSHKTYMKKAAEEITLKECKNYVKHVYKLYNIDL